MKHFSMFVYRILRLLSRWFLRILYPGMQVEGEEYVNVDGPFILAGNHPNTLIDPLILGIHLRSRLHFMANAGLFGNPVLAAFLRFAGVIPVARRGIDGEAGKKVDNKKSFEEAYRHFEQGGILYVAPEGGSELERKLRQPLKTGTARIAFAVEERNNWNLNLRIIPGAGNYEAPTRSFSRAYIRFGPPIRVADYRELYEENTRKAVQKLTADLGEQMAALLIDTRDKTEERCLRPIERAVQNDDPYLFDIHYKRTQKILDRIRELSPEDYEATCAAATTYEQALKAAKVEDVSLSRHPEKKGSPGLWLGLPLFLYGAINHALLVWLPELAWSSLDIYRNYAGTVRGLVGIILLPIVYGLQAWLLSFAIGGWAWLYLLTLPVAGIFALAYYTTYRPYWVSLLQRSRVSEELKDLRKTMLNSLVEKAVS